MINFFTGMAKLILPFLLLAICLSFVHTDEKQISKSQGHSKMLKQTFWDTPLFLLPVLPQPSKKNTFFLSESGFLSKARHLNTSVVSIDSIAPICLTPSTNAFELTATITGDPGTGIWSGNGITDNVFGIFDPQIAGIGTHIITYTFSNPDTFIITTTEIQIIQQPDATFFTDDVICELDTLDILFFGEAGPTAQFEWNFDEGNILSGAGEGPYRIYWDTSGDRLVQLLIVDGVCMSDTFEMNIQVDPKLDTPNIICEETFTSISYEWNPIEHSTAYVVSVINGPLGLITSDTSYLLQGLTPGQTIGIKMVVVSANSCPGSITLPVCTTTYCPENVDAIVPFGPVCIAPGQTDTITLEHNIDETLSEFAASWLGPGIIDSLGGKLVINDQMLGLNEVYLFLDSDVCTAYDTLIFEVFPGPVADFSMPDTACFTEEIPLVFTGTNLTGSILSWGLDGGNILSNSPDNDSLTVHWPTPGSKVVTLQIDHPDCTGSSISYPIEIQVAPTLPQINCEANLTEILFTWPFDPTALGYQVIVNEGPPGNLTSDTSYLVQNLLPGETSGIEVILLSANECPSVSNSSSCVTLACPDVILEIEEVTPICFESTDTLQLELAQSMGMDTGTFYWSGNGIIDEQIGLFELNAMQINQLNEIIAIYEESVCFYSDTLQIAVNLQPESSFVLADSLCLGDTTSVVYTGNASISDDFNWNFGNATAINTSTGPGPIQLTWNSPGVQNLSLSVEASGCVSEESLDSIMIFSPLNAPEPECNASTNNIELNWPAVPGATGYEFETGQNFDFTWTSDTSVLITGLTPDTLLDFTLIALNDNLCGNTYTSFSCTTLPCLPVIFTWTADQENLCLGDQTNILFDITGSDTFNIIITAGNDMTAYPNIDNGTSIPFLPTQNTTYQITSIENQNTPACIPEIPEAINIEVYEPLEAGTATDPEEICSGINAVVLLPDLILGYQPGGTWSDNSTPSSLPGALNANTGTLSVNNPPAGTFSFLYTLPSPLPCPADEVEVSLIINESPIADAGEDLTLDCLIHEVSIGSNETSTGSDINIQWTSAGGTPIEHPNDPVIEVNQADQYFLTTTNNQTGCSSMDEVMVSSDLSSLTAYSSFTPITCFGENNGIIRLDSVAGGTPPYLISFNGSPVVAQTLFSGLATGDYELLIIDSEGCQTSSNISLDAPQPLTVQLNGNFETDEPFIQIGDDLLLTAIVNRLFSEIDTVVWNPNTLQLLGPLSVSDQPGVTSTYTISVTDVNGCKAMDVLTVFVRKNNNVYIPNSFSPNNDGINDLFMIFAGKGVEEVVNFSIFNRWGEMVFQQKNFQPNEDIYGWDGKFYGQPMNPAVFVYSAEIKMVDGEVVIFKGEVNLIR